MKNHIGQFRKDLLELAGYAQSTVDTYSASVSAFADHARQGLAIEPLSCRGSHIQDWLKVVSPGISRSRLRQHQYALKCFFAFLVRRGIIDRNPAEPLPDRRKHPSDKNQPLADSQVFRLLAGRRPRQMARPA